MCLDKVAFFAINGPTLEVILHVGATDELFFPYFVHRCLRLIRNEFFQGRYLIYLLVVR